MFEKFGLPQNEAPPSEKPHKMRLLETPFRKNPKKSVFGKEKIKTIKGHPDKIIRSESLERLSKYYRIKDPIEAGLMGKKMFDELKNNYGIDNSAQFVIGRDEFGSPNISVIADKVNGKNLWYRESFSPKEERELNSLFLSLIDYISDKYNNNKPFLYDISKDTQYVFGTTKSQPEERLYLIDFDLQDVAPTYQDPDLENSIDPKDGMQAWKDRTQREEERVENILSFMKNYKNLVLRTEKKLGKKFPNVREALRQFIASLKVSGVRYHIEEEFKDF